MPWQLSATAPQNSSQSSCFLAVACPPKVDISLFIMRRAGDGAGRAEAETGAGRAASGAAPRASPSWKRAIRWRSRSASVASEELAASGVRPGTIRLSVGTESVEDLVWDLGQAFDRLAATLPQEVLA